MQLLSDVLGGLPGAMIWLLQRVHGVTGSWGAALVVLATVVSAAEIALGALGPGRRSSHGDDPPHRDLRAAWLIVVVLLDLALRGAAYAGLYLALQGPALRGAPLLWVRDMTVPDPGPYFLLAVAGNFILSFGSTIWERDVPQRGWALMMTTLLHLLLGALAVLLPAGLACFGLIRLFGIAKLIFVALAFFPYLLVQKLRRERA